MTTRQIANPIRRFFIKGAPRRGCDNLKVRTSSYLIGRRQALGV